MQTQRWDGTVVLPDGEQPNWAVVFDQTIRFVGPSEFAPKGDLRFKAPYILPGLIDVHTHGAGGASFPDANTIEDVEQAAASHLRNGTTTLLASLVTAPLGVMEDQAALLAEACRAGVIGGIHFEGPFLAQSQKGAQDADSLTTPSRAKLGRLIAAAGTWARSMTIAPELVTRELVEQLADANVIPSWGHTDATAAQARAAIELSKTVLAPSTRATVTHLFNGMRPMHHRQPGAIPEFLASGANGDLALELICDGVHVSPELIRNVVELVGRENILFVTDSMAAAGLSDGQYDLGPQRVTVADGVARLSAGNALAGGTAHLIDCVRVGVVEAKLDLCDAVYMAATGPARQFGWADRGEIAVGKRADLVAVGEGLEVLQVASGRIRCVVGAQGEF